MISLEWHLYQLYIAEEGSPCYVRNPPESFSRPRLTRSNASTESSTLSINTTSSPTPLQRDTYRYRSRTRCAKMPPSSELLSTLWSSWKAGYSLTRTCPNWTRRIGESGETLFPTSRNDAEEEQVGSPQSGHSVHCLLFRPRNSVSRALVPRTPTSLAK